MNVLITLHGANMPPASMDPIVQEIDRYFTLQKHITLVLPGDDTRGMPTKEILSLDDIARDICEQINSEDPDLNWRKVILFGESIGALVLATAVQLMDVTPMAALFGEPPLSNGYGMRQMRSHFAKVDNPRANALKNALGLMTEEPVDLKYLFSRPEYPVLLMFGLKRECDEITPFHSVIEQGELDSLPEHANLLTCE